MTQYAATGVPRVSGFVVERPRAACEPAATPWFPWGFPPLRQVHWLERIVTAACGIRRDTPSSANGNRRDHRGQLPADHREARHRAARFLGCVVCSLPCLRTGVRE